MKEFSNAEIGSEGSEYTWNCWQQEASEIAYASGSQVTWARKQERRERASFSARLTGRESREAPHGSSIPSFCDVGIKQ
jgi:hypothetical protein